MSPILFLITVFRCAILNAAQMILLIVRNYLQIRAEFAYA